MALSSDNSYATTVYIMIGIGAITDLDRAARMADMQ